MIRKASVREATHPISAPIASRDNRWLKRFRAALSGDENDDGLIGVEGLRMVEAALGSRLPIEVMLISESGERYLADLGSLVSPQVQLLRTTDRLFAGVAGTHTPQGIAALLRPRTATFEDLLSGTPLVIVLAGVQDPGNVGTILRAAEAFGGTGAVTCAAGSAAGSMGTADPLSPKALRASAGSTLRLPIVRGMNPIELSKRLRTAGVKSFAAVADSFQPRQGESRSLRPWEIDWKSPSALLIGNEGSGLPDGIVRAADARVSIPQATANTPVGIESLNAAMAATVLLYEAMRQRNGTPKKL